MWDILKKELKNYSKDDVKLIHQAYDIAEKSHGNQKRMSGAPYISHPVEVAKKLIELELDAPTIAAGVLHDVLEDTDYPKEDLEKNMGREVTFLVEAMTKLDQARYRGFERTAESMRKMFLAVAQDVRVVLIKLADRLHNMKTIKALRPDKQKRIAKETLEIYAPLAYQLNMGELRGELEDLCFPIVYPEESEWLKREVKKYMPQRREYLERIAPHVDAALNNNHIKNFQISFRAKHNYSLWRKLLKHDLDLGQIFDLIAFRIVMNSIEDCYQALGVIHSIWKPIPGRIKDYVAMPKPNGYRSLHTTVIGEDLVVLEFQIRTKEMHEEAEFGVTAHWAYKEGQAADPQKIAWIKKLASWQEQFNPESEDDDGFVEALKLDFFKDRIFVLTPQGEVIDLPEGATPIDFAYHIHSEVGDKMSGARVNNKMVAFSHVLRSGDRVEIITSKKQKPSPDWLSMAQSTMARGHIRAALRRLGIEPYTPVQPQKPSGRDITFYIVSDRRVGMLKDITTVLAKEKVNIIKTDTDKEDVNKPFLLIKCRVPKKLDLKKLLVRIKRVKGVKEITIK
ncbi:MAG: RelA/SpoT family protein [bacterium]|nr:RelA/SpoT family protein [bacterium]